MKGILVVVFLLLMQNSGRSQDMLFNKDLVDLKGRICYTILKNSTPDTLKINARAFYYLPYYETEFKLEIPPQHRDTLEVSLAYPDFINLSSLGIKVWNAPGKVVECDLRSLDPGRRDISFRRDLVPENNYYLAYQNEFRNFFMETTAYYRAGSRVSDFNTFPALADSITRLSLSFLDSHKQSLPEWFVQHETARLKYNGGFKKYHVPFDKAFRENRKIDVRPDYYAFEETLPLKAEGMVLNTEYLWFACFRLIDRAKPEGSLRDRFALLDSLVGVGPVSDVIRMRLLSNVYKTSGAEYEYLMSRTAFFDERNRAAVDSITARKNKYPVVGSVAPDFSLTDISGKRVSLHAFAGKPVIISFWASWCLPCLKELPYENVIYKKYSERGLVMINVCIDTDREKWKSISRQENLTMINLFATGADYERIRAACQIGELPRNILINRDLTVRDNYFRKASSVSDADMEAILGY